MLDRLDELGDLFAATATLEQQLPPARPDPHVPVRPVSRYRSVAAHDQSGRTGSSGQRATKYLALGWWRMMAEVVCSGWYW